MNGNGTRTTPGVSFGPFRLFAAERRLERDGVAVQLGSRALDVLIVLIERAGEVVSKKELMARVWPDVTVDESSLRVHVASLRKALGEGQPGARYVTNIPGRGYCFVAPLTGSGVSPPVAAEPTVSDQVYRLPARLARMVGRDEAVRTIVEQLADQRFVTVLGPGGIGKTTVAISVGHAQLAAFDGAVCFVDLGPLSDARLVPSALASTLGLLVQSDDPTPGLIRFLRDRRMLLILDSCEHVVDSAAALAEHIFEEAPHVHILATSREALRVEGEHVHRLEPLGSPPEGIALTAAQMMAFPAAQLFVERAAAAGHRFELTDADAPVVAEICRKLDGIALAIELAAGRVGGHGVRETAALLDNRFRLLWRGRRTALPRHQTLSATLDWSYDLLSDPERAVLRRLAVFVGFFTLEAAQAVAAADAVEAAQVVEALGRLVAKSLVSASAGTAATRYRLLDTTRAYALGKLMESGETDLTARRHALYFRDYLERAGAPDADHDFAAWADHLGNVRAALEWCFFERRDIDLGTALAAASARLFMDMSLLGECHRWTERALAELDETMRGSRREMTLQGALGVSLMFTQGNNDRAHAAYVRGLELAERHDDRIAQLRLLGRLHIFHERAGDFHRALEFAQRGAAVAHDIGDAVGIAAGHSLLGISYHLLGNQAEARIHLEAALVQPPASQHIHTIHFGFHHRNRARIALARTLWLQGYPDQAVRTARDTVDEACAIGHPVTLCIALIWAVSVYGWTGDWASAEESINRFIAQAERHSLAPYRALGAGVKGELAARRGEPEAGAELLRRALEALHADRYELLTAALNSALAEALAMSGRWDEAITLIDDTIALVERNGDLFSMPDLLRIKGDFLAATAQPERAQTCFLEAIELAALQSAPSWQLRAATSLARLWSEQGRGAEARERLAAAYDQFAEGYDTADLRAARALLA